MIFRRFLFHIWIFQQILHYLLKKNFFRPHSKKLAIFVSKISIWVLKRTVLTSWIPFSILKIYLRSFSTLIRNIRNKRFIYITLVYFFRSQNDLQWIFSMKKRIQHVKTVHLSAHINILQKNKSNLQGPKKSKKFFQLRL